MSFIKNNSNPTGNYMFRLFFFFLDGVHVTTNKHLQYMS